jgi:tetratricopeptide (TPR) repeat protein
MNKHIHLALAVLLALLTQVSGAAAQPSGGKAGPPPSHFERGTTYYVQALEAAPEEARRLYRESCAAYRAAVAQDPPAPKPEKWAIHQALGLCLDNLGQLSAPPESTKLLAEARREMVAALEIPARDRSPGDVADLQQDLGSILYQLGIRSRRADAESLLAESVAAYQRALTFYGRKTHPEEWAATRNGLANTLQDQALRTEDPAKSMQLLREAVATYYDVLLVRTREEAPDSWAMVQGNLAIAFKDQAVRSSGEQRTKLLNDAAAAYGNALAVYDRESHPVAWANNRKNLGLTLKLLGRQSEANAAFRDALEIDPGNRSLTFALVGEYLEQTSTFGDALKLARAWLEKNPQDADMQVQLLECMFVAGDFQAAERHAEKLGELEDPTNAIVREAYAAATSLARNQSAAGRAKLDSLIAKVAAQEAEFRLTWSFGSALAALRGWNDLAHRETQQAFFEALEAGDREAVLAGLRQVRQRLA